MVEPLDNPPLEDFNPTNPITEYDWLIPVADYVACIACGVFTDDDGYGYPTNETHEDRRFKILPSLGVSCIPLLATHINWFNR